MIIEKNYDTDGLHPSLFEAIKAAAECGDYKKISFQKFMDDETGELWGFSFTEKLSEHKINLLATLGILRLFEDCDSVKLEDLLCEQLADLIEKEWDEKNTIQIKTTYFQDEYDMYGVNRSDFC